MPSPTTISVDKLSRIMRQNGLVPGRAAVRCQRMRESEPRYRTYGLTFEPLRWQLGIVFCTEKHCDRTDESRLPSSAHTKRSHGSGIRHNQLQRRKIILVPADVPREQRQFANSRMSADEEVGQHTCP